MSQMSAADYPWASEVETHPGRPNWPRGPWDNEPDKVVWRKEGIPFPMMIVRSGSTGALCGYVGVSPGHPHYGVDFSEIDADVHWGLTYSGGCGGTICHKPLNGEPDHVWWLGFDCAHCEDLAPGLMAWSGTYRDLEWVKAETERLAEQLLP